MGNILLTFKDDINAFLKNNALYLCLGIIALILIVIFLIFVINRKKKNSK